MKSALNTRIALLGVLLVLLLLSACDGHNWNNPYSPEDAARNALYTVFTERPKHLDPVQSYSSNEIQFTAQIYEPPLQYHYLKRPYVLIPATAKEMPTVRYFDAQGNQLPDDARAGDIAYSSYEISIRPGILFQPHPAFAVDVQGNGLFHELNQQELTSIHKLSDFPQTGTRELVADDYVYQIKRLAHPKLHSPIYGLMADYIAGLREYAEVLKQAEQNQPAEKDFLDLRNYPLEGVQAVDRYTYRITVIGKYPQFVYWLAMPFFAPIPWEADRFYSQRRLIQKNITLDWYPVGTGPYMLTE
ncbi:MAG: peptide ABC transporter substrate-binding protein, partial [Proteobacteria bacterium]|nr:peptide ABC transporter substrate-binding protein [Pseudomonadota bacterium]